MRTISTDDNALFTAPGGRATFLRIDVADAGAVFRDLTTYPGVNMVLSATWKDSTDDNGQSGEITLKREQEQLSLAPLMQASPLNNAFAFPQSYAALLQVGRGVRIYTADVPADSKPGAADWKLMLDGYIDTVDSASTENVVLEVSDGQAKLRDTFVELERVYAYAQGGSATAGAQVWSPLLSTFAGQLVIPTETNRNGHFYVAQSGTSGSPVSTSAAEPVWPTVSGATVSDGSQTWKESGLASAGAVGWTKSYTAALNSFIVPSDQNRNGHVYKATVAGVTSGTTEPTWPTGAGSTVTDNGITWTESGVDGTAVESVMGQIITDNGLSISVTTPGGSPGWNVRWFLQQRQSVWDALRALTDQIGWDLRSKFDSGSGTFKLALTQPNRSASTPDRTFGPSETWDVQGLKVDVSTIRNVVAGVFSSSGSLDPTGQPLRFKVVVQDSASIAKYGRRYMEIGEASTSNIDTTAELTTMITNAVTDLKEPNAEKTVVLPYFPFTELGDLYRFSPDAIYSDQNLDLAVVSYQHTVQSDGDSSTQLVCRGKPSAGTARWLAQGAELNGDDIHQLAVVDADSVTLQASSVVGGTMLTAQGTQNKRALGQDYEWHVGTSPGFTPDKTTVVQSQGGNQVTVPSLIANKQYYAKATPIRRNAQRIVRGQPSAALAFTAGRAAAGHINEGVAFGAMPLNGGFEDRSDPAGMPDHWYLLNGTFPANFDVMSDANGVSGGNYLKVITSASLTKARSALIPLVNDDAAGTSLRLTQRYLISCWVKPDAANTGANNLLITAAGVDYQGTLIGNMGGSGVITVAATNNVGKWRRLEAIVHSDGFSTMKGVYVYVSQDTGGVVGTIYYVDEIRIVPIGSPWYIVGQTTKFTDALESVPAFAASWVAQGAAPAGQPAFRRAQDGRIHLKGQMKNGTIGSAAFVLPPTFRPVEDKFFSVHEGTSTAPGYLTVDTSGNVIPANGGNTFFSLDGVAFDRFS